MDEFVKRFEYSQDDYINSTVAMEKFDESQMSKLDQLLRSRWQDSMDKGHFRYTLDEMQTKQLEGKWNFLAQLNTKRLSERRTPQVMKTVKTPFDPDKFHFNKVKPEEIILQLCPRHEKNSKENHCHPVLINVSPLDFGHCLLVPEMHRNLPQVLTETGLRVSLEMVLLSAHPGFRLGFNGLCALASVNHQHVHVWYTEYRLPAEQLEVKHLAGDCYETVDWPAPAFVFQLHGSTVEKVVRQVVIITDYFQENETAYNIFATRGSSFHDCTISTLRVYIWPRLKVTSQKMQTDTDFSVATVELGGQVPMFIPEVYERITESDIVDKFQQFTLPNEEHTALRMVICNLCGLCVTS